MTQEGKKVPVQGSTFTRGKRDRTYREFTSFYYNKYKHQFPNLRESEVTRKIQREWLMKTHEQVVELYKKYDARGFSDQIIDDSDD